MKPGYNIKPDNASLDLQVRMGYGDIDSQTNPLLQGLASRYSQHIGALALTLLMIGTPGCPQRNNSDSVDPTAVVFPTQEGINKIKNDIYRRPELDKLFSASYSDREISDRLYTTVCEIFGVADADEAVKDRIFQRVKIAYETSLTQDERVNQKIVANTRNAKLYTAQKLDSILSEVLDYSDGLRLGDIIRDSDSPLRIRQVVLIQLDAKRQVVLHGKKYNDALTPDHFLFDKTGCIVGLKEGEEPIADTYTFGVIDYVTEGPSPPTYFVLRNGEGENIRRSSSYPGRTSRPFIEPVSPTTSKQVVTNYYVPGLASKIEEYLSADNAVWDDDVKERIKTVFGLSDDVEDSVIDNLMRRVMVEYARYCTDGEYETLEKIIYAKQARDTDPNRLDSNIWSAIDGLSWKGTQLKYAVNLTDNNQVKLVSGELVFSLMNEHGFPIYLKEGTELKRTIYKANPKGAHDINLPDKYSDTPYLFHRRQPLMDYLVGRVVTGRTHLLPYLELDGDKLDTTGMIDGTNARRGQHWMVTCKDVKEEILTQKVYEAGSLDELNHKVYQDLERDGRLDKVKSFEATATLLDKEPLGIRSVVPGRKADLRFMSISGIINTESQVGVESQSVSIETAAGAGVYVVSEFRNTVNDSGLQMIVIRDAPTTNSLMLGGLEAVAKSVACETSLAVLQGALDSVTAPNASTMTGAGFVKDVATNSSSHLLENLVKHYGSDDAALLIKFVKKAKDWNDLMGKISDSANWGDIGALVAKYGLKEIISNLKSQASGPLDQKCEEFAQDVQDLFKSSFNQGYAMPKGAILLPDGTFVYQNSAGDYLIIPKGEHNVQVADIPLKRTHFGGHKLNTNESIVDALIARGLPSDFDSRKTYFESQHAGQTYSGSAEQNTGWAQQLSRSSSQNNSSSPSNSSSDDRERVRDGGTGGGDDGWDHVERMEREKASSDPRDPVEAAFEGIKERERNQASSDE